MAYDETLAARIRELLVDEPGLTEMKMFGGLAFLVSGNMAVAASGQGGVLVRADPAQGEKLLATTKARPMEMRGPRDAGMAASRRGRRADQAAARTVGRDRRDLRPLTPSEAAMSTVLLVGLSQWMINEREDPR